MRGIAEGVPLPLTVKIRLGAGSSEAPVHQLAEAVERAGARDGAAPRVRNPSSAAVAATSRIVRIQVAGSRTTPPLPTADAPASNWGLTIGSAVARSAASDANAGSTFPREMKERSATITSGRCGARS